MGKIPFWKYYFTGSRAVFSIPFALFFIAFWGITYWFGLESFSGAGGFIVSAVIATGINVACYFQAKSTYKNI